MNRRIRKPQPAVSEAACPSCGGRGSISTRNYLVKCLLQWLSIYVFRCLRCDRRFVKRFPAAKSQGQA